MTLLKQIKRASNKTRHLKWKIDTTVKRSKSWWAGLQTGPADPIFGVTEKFKADPNPNKVLLGVGAYRTDEGKPFVLPCVRKAEEILIQKQLDHEYLPQGGLPEFNKAAALLALGENSCILKDGLNLTVQALGGTGAIRLGTTFLSMFYPGSKVIYIPNPSWGNHKQISMHAGLLWKPYKYYNPQCIDIDFCGMCEDINNMPENSIILFHAVAHNPTGLDPNIEQWHELSHLCMEKKLFVFFDMAYQGFASGDTDADAMTVRQFIEDGHQIALAQSFSKNMGLYGERVGALTLITSSQEELERVNSQMKIVIRALYSNPPAQGARIVSLILNEHPLKCQWLKDVKGMAVRIKRARQELVDNLKKAGSHRNWDHVTKQIGMFSFTGLTKEEVARLADEHSVYLTSDGRMAVASLGSKNSDYVANAIHAVTRSF